MRFEKDVILINIRASYQENITTKKLYEVSSFSWKIGEERLKQGFKYYCAVYKNEIKEIYEFLVY